MTNSSMVERVARAICKAEGCAPGMIDEHWKNYRSVARAAIAAMREPTEEMINASHRLSGEYNNWRDVRKDEYVSMISAALKEKDG